jgi:uncharacterized glyoxalase superfamily protein PhnB
MSQPARGSIATCWGLRSSRPSHPRRRTCSCGSSATAEDYPGVDSRPAGGTAALFFLVSDVDALHVSVAPHASVLMPLKTQFYGMREFAIADLDGHILTFAQRVG